MNLTHFTPLVILGALIFLGWLMAQPVPESKLEKARKRGYEYAKGLYEDEPTVDTLDELEIQSLGFGGDTTEGRAFDRGIRDFIWEIRAEEIPG